MNSKFQKRHYDAIADALAGNYNVYTAARSWKKRQAVDEIAEALIDVFRRDNPQFVPSRFKAACQNRD